MGDRPWKLLTILEQTSTFFTQKGLENARLQAELLLADVLDTGRLDLYLQFERVLTSTEVERYRAHVKTRLQGVPVQYITGEAGFRHLVLAVTPAVLIPRPETEILVDAILERLEGNPAPRVLDLCCGSGAIGLAVASECPTAQVVATDQSPEALAMAQDNAHRCEVGEQVHFFCSDLFAALEPESDPFDLIASNPPYIRRGDLAGLDPEVIEHEPRMALDGGEDGLDFYRLIVAQASSFLKQQGHLVLEVGDDQAAAVTDLVQAQSALDLEETRPDLNDVPRVLVIRHSA
ncbi:MAG: peptide chain release factor N(5)-glutamine methyltransferase [Candidatus Latescibacteria bacterium]|nr:peptide chain release factor N(5)-glutamine methyltransferase [Candidatus Latescibacterota bacterium]